MEETTASRLMIRPLRQPPGFDPAQRQAPELAGGRDLGHQRARLDAARVQRHQVLLLAG